MIHIQYIIGLCVLSCHVEQDYVSSILESSHRIFKSANTCLIHNNSQVHSAIALNYVSTLLTLPMNKVPTQKCPIA